MWSSKRSATPAHIRRLCTLGLPAESVVPALMRALCREAHCDAGVVLWFDARGEISNLYAHNLPAPAEMVAWFSPLQEPNTASRLPVAAGVTVRRSELVETCADDDDGRMTVEARPEPFCPHRHLCGMAGPAGKPLQRLCCAIVRHGAPVASLMLYRPATVPSFSSEERTVVKAAGRYLSLNGCATLADTSAAMYRAGGEQALLLCEPDGRVVKASANGYEFLAQASGCAINRKTVPEELEHAGRDLIRRLFADVTGHTAHDAHGEARCTTLINAWGLFRLRVFWEPNGQRGVLIERVEHLLVRLVAAMWHLDLSVQQGEVLLLLAQGLSHDRIADRMGVSPNTADYHIRQLYSKLGVHTRNEAIAYVLDAPEASRAA
jgi:DNA-binding CsgD family transcriptional regulator